MHVQHPVWSCGMCCCGLLWGLLPALYAPGWYRLLFLSHPVAPGGLDPLSAHLVVWACVQLAWCQLTVLTAVPGGLQNVAVALAYILLSAPMW
jgi:hypothetical protein